MDWWNSITFGFEDIFADFEGFEDELVEYVTSETFGIVKEIRIGEELLIDVKPVLYGNCFSVKYLRKVDSYFILPVVLNFTSMLNISSKMLLKVHQEEDDIGTKITT